MIKVYKGIDPVDDSPTIWVVKGSQVAIIWVTEFHKDVETSKNTLKRIAAHGGYSYIPLNNCGVDPAKVADLWYELEGEDE